jgi:molecular chaperone Hsp33
MDSIRLPDDIVVPFYIDEAQVRGRLVRLGSQLNQILENHSYPTIINHYLAELVAIGVALSTDTKQEGLFTLQITGGQTIKMMVVDITSEGTIRACAKWNEESLENLLKNTNDNPSLRELFSSAFLVFTIDLVNKDDRYQAVVELAGSTLSECMHHFFRQSDQVPTGIVVGTQINTEGENYLAASIILQKLPPSSDSSAEEIEKEEDAWFTDLSLLGTVTKQELLDKNLTADTLLYRLFHERNIRVLPVKEIVSKCYCSRERIVEILSNFSETDLTDMIVDDQINVTCEFCDETQTFNKDEIDTITQLEKQPID